MKQSSKEFEREVKNAGLGILVGRLFFLSWGVDKLKEIKENNTLVSELGYKFPSLNSIVRLLIQKSPFGHVSNFCQKQVSDLGIWCPF